jgi:hypothetical protein
MTSRNRSGTITFLAERAPRWFAIIVTALFGVCALFPFIAGKYLMVRSPKWVAHVPGAAIAVSLALVVVAVTWGCSRGWRMGLHVDHNGVTVRNYFRTYRVGWLEVNSFADASICPFLLINNEQYWALSVLMRSGDAITASSTARLRRARPEMLTAIGQVAECYGIAADLTGAPGAWLGPRWRSYLPLLLIVILGVLFLAGMALGRGSPCPFTSCAGGGGSG